MDMYNIFIDGLCGFEKGAYPEILCCHNSIRFKHLCV